MRVLAQALTSAACALAQQGVQAAELVPGLAQVQALALEPEQVQV